MDIVKDCRITQSDAKVLKEYVVDRNNPLYSKYKGYSTGLNLSANDVHNLYTGKVVLVCGNSKIGYDVIVQMNFSQCMKYSNLKSTDVSLGQDLDLSERIGLANRYVKVEYLNSEISNSFPVRIGQNVFYKDDPAKIIDGDGAAVASKSLLYSTSGLQDVIDEYDGGTDDEDDTDGNPWEQV